MDDTTGTDSTVSLLTTTRHVDDEAGCAGQSPCYATIQAAVDASVASDEIVVRPGVYAPFTIAGKNNLVVRGVEADAVFVDGGGAAAAAVVTNATGVRLQDLTLRNAVRGVRLQNAGVGGYASPVPGQGNTALRTTLDGVLVHDVTTALEMDRVSAAVVLSSTLVSGSGGSGIVDVTGPADPSMAAAWSTASTLPVNVPATVGASSSTLAESNAVYVSPGNATLYKSTGGGWTQQTSGPTGLAKGVRAAVASGSGTLWNLRSANVGGMKFDAAHASDRFIMNASVVSGADTYMAGHFETIVGTDYPIIQQPDGSDVTINHVARWDGKSWNAMGGSNAPISTDRVYAMVADANYVYIAGDLNGPNDVRRWSKSSGVWEVMGTGLPLFSVVHALTIDPSTGTLYAGGDFRPYQYYGYPSDHGLGAGRQNCEPGPYEVTLFEATNFGGDCAVLGPGEYTNSSSWPSYPQTVGNDTVSSILVGPLVKAQLYGATNYAGASSTFTGDDGAVGTDNSNGQPIFGNDSLSSIKVQFEGSPNRVAKWNGSSWVGLEGGVDGGNVYALDYFNGTLYAAGDFTNASSSAYTSNIALFTDHWFNLSSAAASSSAINGTVRALDVRGSGDIYVAGTFPSAQFAPSGGTVQTVTASNVAHWATNVGWQPLGTTSQQGTDATVRTMVDVGGTLYFGGDFGTVRDAAGTTTANRLAAWTISTSRWSTVGSNAPLGATNGYFGSVPTRVNTLAVDGNDIWLGGKFNGFGAPLNAGGRDIARITLSTKYTTATNSWTDWDTTDAQMAFNLRSGATGISDGAGHLYFLAGTNSTAFARYGTGSDTWTSLTALPAAAGAGLTMAWANGGVYALLGNTSGTLYRFDPGTNSWSTPAAAPVNFAGGAALAWDGFDSLYAMQGDGSQAFLRYRPSRNEWETMPNLPGLGIQSAGGGLARLGSQLFAVLGGTGTQVRAFGPIGFYPEKLTLDKVAFVAPETAGTKRWLASAVPASDFLVGGSGTHLSPENLGGSSWAPTSATVPMSTTFLSHAAAGFVDPANDVYRVPAGSPLAAGYHRPDFTDVHVYPSRAACDRCDLPLVNPQALVWGANAFGDIQQAIDQRPLGVIVHAGQYPQPFHLTSGVRVVGAGADRTIISATPPVSGTTRLVLVEGVAGATLARVTLDGGHTAGGPAGTVDAFRAEQGAHAVSLTRNIIRRAGGSAISLDGVATDVEVASNTLVSNARGVRATSCAGIDVRNTIFDHHSITALDIQACAANALHTYNDFFGNAIDFAVGGSAVSQPGRGEIFSDPLFADAAADDYRPERGSPVVDAGNPSDPVPPGAGGRVDIGYVEQGAAAFYADDDYCESCLNDGLEWQVDAFATIQSALNAAGNAVHALSGAATDPRQTVGVGPGTYAEHLTVPSHVRLVGVGAEQVTVDAGGTGSAVTLNGVVDVEVRGLRLRGASAPALHALGASNTITVSRNLIANNASNGVRFDGGATGVLKFNTLVANTGAALHVEGAGSRVDVADSIASGNGVGWRTASGGLVASAFNLLHGNTTNLSGVTAGTNDRIGVTPGFANTNDYQLLPTSPAVDTAEQIEPAPAGGGDRADLGYRELLAPPMLLLFGKEGASACAVGNAGLGQVQVGLAPVADAGLPITATLPTTWYSATISTLNQTASYWTAGLTPSANGMYRLYTRATDRSGNAESDPEDWFSGALIADGTAPTVTWTSPAAGASISGAAVHLVATASDYVDAGGSSQFAVQAVTFEVDGSPIPADWSVGWSGTGPRSFNAFAPVATGAHTIEAVAVDKAGNVGRSGVRTVNVSGVFVVAMAALTPNPLSQYWERGQELGPQLSVGPRSSSPLPVLGEGLGVRASSAKERLAGAQTSSEAATITSPLTGTAVSASALTVRGVARFATANGNAGRVEVRVDGGAPVAATLDDNGATLTGWQADVTIPAVQGFHTVTVSLFGVGDTDSVRIVLDSVAPSVNIVSPAAGAVVRAVVPITITASDSGSGLAGVNASFDGGFTWVPASLVGGSWRVDWTTPDDVEDVSFPVRVRATDAAGNEAVAPIVLVVDNAPPLGLTPVTFSVPEGSHLDGPTSVLVNWQPAIEPVGGASVRFLVDHAPTTVPGAANAVVGLAAMAQFSTEGTWYVHLSAVDDAGGAAVAHFGPWLVGGFADTAVACADREQTIVVDGLLDRQANEWRDDRERLDDDERGVEAGHGVQELYATWEGDAIFVGWQGAWWTLDGRMWAYLDLVPGAGTTQQVEPGTALPFNADYAVAVDAPDAGTLYRWTGSAWQIDTPSGFAFANGESGGTEVRIPLPGDLGGITTARLIAFSEDGGTVWSAFPTTNPVAGPWNGFFQWNGPCSIAVPNQNQPKGTNVGLAMTSPQASGGRWGPGQNLDYVLTLDNHEAITLTGLQVILTASGGLTFSGLPFMGGSYTAGVPTLGAESTIQLTVTGGLAANLAGIDAVTVNAELRNGGGTVLATAVLSHTVDAVAPTVDVFGLSTVLQPGPTTIYGSADDGDGAGVAAVFAQVGGNSLPVSGTLGWSTQVVVPSSGTFDLSAWASDVRGNTSAPKVFSFAVDSQPPTVTFTLPPVVAGDFVDLDGTTRDAGPAASQVERVEVQVDDEDAPWQEAIGPFAPNHARLQAWHFSWDVPPQSGVTHRLRARAYDTVGNVSAPSAWQTTFVKADSATTITGVNPAVATVNQPVTIAVTVTSASPNVGFTPTGNVTVTDGAVSCVVALPATSCQLTPVTAGTKTLGASYSGDSLFIASAGSTDLVVDKAATTAVVLSAPNPAERGELVILRADVFDVPTGPADPTGTVEFLDGANVIGTGALNPAGVATASLNFLVAGNHSLTARYVGDANFNVGVSPAITQTVIKTPTAATLTVAQNPSVYGQIIVLSASVTSTGILHGLPTGMIELREGATVLGTARPNDDGSIAYNIRSLIVGAHILTAVYVGDADFASSTSATFTQTVNKAGCTATLTASPNPTILGQAVNLAATVVAIPGWGVPTGPLTFTDGAASLGTASVNGSGQATSTTSGLAVGSHQLGASYGGDANFSACASVAITQTVNKANTTTAVTSSANPAAAGTMVTFTATVAPVGSGLPVPGGSVEFRDGATVLGTRTLAGGTAAFGTSTLSVGTHVITTVYLGDGNFNGSTSPAVNQSITSTPPPPPGVDLAVIQTDSPDPVAAGSQLTYRITITNNSSSATSVTLTDTLPTQVTFASRTPAPGWTCTQPTGKVVCTVGSLAGGAQAVTIVVVNVPSTLPANTRLDNAVTVRGAASDPNMANNSQTVQTTVFRAR